MTIDQLRIFLEVARQQHVTQAASVLNLTQSTVSAAIKALETRHGVQLFNRLGRGIHLTGEGEQFVALAEKVLASVRDAEQLLRDFGIGNAGQLKLFASQTVASVWLPQRLVQFHQHCPAISIGLEVSNTQNCVEAIIKGKADAAFIEASVDDPELSQLLVGFDQLVLLVGEHHRWSRTPPRGFAELFETGWILREAGSGTRATFERKLRAEGYDPEQLDIFLELPSNESVCAAVEGSKLATAISRDVAQPYLSAGRMIAPAFDLPSRPFHMIRHRDRHRSRALGLLEEFLTAESPASGPRSRQA